MCIGASAADTSVRSMIKLMMATCRWVEVRQKAMSHMECKWLVFDLDIVLFVEDEYQLLLFSCLSLASLAREFHKERQTIAAHDSPTDQLTANTL